MGHARKSLECGLLHYGDGEGFLGGLMASLLTKVCSVWRFLRSLNPLKVEFNEALWQPSASNAKSEQT